MNNLVCTVAATPICMKSCSPHRQRWMCLIFVFHENVSFYVAFRMEIVHYLSVCIGGRGCLCGCGCQSVFQLACLTAFLSNHFFFWGIRNYNTEDTGIACGPNGISSHGRWFHLGLHVPTHRMKVTSDSKGHPQDVLCPVGCLSSHEMVLLEGTLMMTTMTSRSTGLLWTDWNKVIAGRP